MKSNGQNSQQTITTLLLRRTIPLMQMTANLIDSDVAAPTSHIKPPTSVSSEPGAGHTSLMSSTATWNIAIRGYFPIGGTPTVIAY